MVKTMNEVNRDKTKVPDYFFFFVMFCLSVLLLNSMSKLIYNQCTCKLVIKTLRLHTVCKLTIGSLFLCFNPLFSVVQFWNYKIIRVRNYLNNPLDFVLGISIIRHYYSFRIFFRVWLVKTTRIIHHSQLLLTKYWTNDVKSAARCHLMSRWRQNDVKSAAHCRLLNRWRKKPGDKVRHALMLPNFHSCFYNSIETWYMFSIS